MTPPDVTVVIPAYRAEKTIGRTIDSIRAQQGCSIRIVVVIDGRLDRSEDIVSTYEDRRIELIVNPENRGAQYSRNLGLERADTEFVMFLDADDYLEGPLVEGLAEALRDHGADLAFGPVRMIRETTGEVLREFVPDFTSPQDLFTRWFGHGRWRSPRSDMVPPCSVLWRTSFIRKIGGWDPEIERNQDGEVVTRAVLLGAKIALSRKGCGIYVNYPGHQSISTRSDNLSGLLKMSEKIRNIETSVVSEEAKLRGCAAFDYSIAWHSFTAGRDDVGVAALRRSRALGHRGNWGSLVPRLIADIFGLHWRFKLGRLADRLRGRSRNSV